MIQKLRKSQFILTYGPGAIIETVEGPRIIPVPSIGLFNRETINGNKFSPENFEINHQRLSDGLLNGARIFSVPSNQELGLSENNGLYSTAQFLSWGLCVKHGILYRLNHGCPECKKDGNTGNQHNRRETIRFVRACPAGHLDDVNWNYVIHSKSKNDCSSDWFYWHTYGSALKETVLVCPKCGSKVTLGEIYNKTWSCSGRYPEKEVTSSQYTENCNREARIIQRQASNLRVPEIVTLFTIPPRHTALHRLLENREIRSGISTLTRVPDSGIPAPGEIYRLNERNFKNMLKGLVEDKLISPAVYDEILKYPWDEIESAIKDLQKKGPASFHELLLEEFHELIKASENGATGKNGAQLLFEVIKEDVRIAGSPGGRNFRIVPVSRLNTVTVQKGYRRFVTADPAEAELVDISFTDSNGNRWLPGVEFLGEGIFIMLDGDEGWHFPMKGDSSKNWLGAFYDGGNYKSGLFRDPEHKIELHPVFVWWHTLSHIIIRILSINSGYSAASIRERIYLEDKPDGRARGGILLYTVQPGTDGTLGGLIALVPRFEEIIFQAAAMVERCSNDPLCAENKFSNGATRGAACYACTMVSETSCEHRNMWLDRHILMENVP
jgi:hypothetical protein